MVLFERRLRLATGLILAVYILLHLLNLSLGIFSLSLMEDIREWITPFWRSIPGSVLLYFSFSIHFLLALRSLYRRTTLRIPLWEAAQLSFGLCIVPLLAGHAAGTWGTRILLDEEVDYEYIISVIYADPWLTTKQVALLLIASVHVAIGLHFWLRIRSWYRLAVPIAYPAVVIIPLLALLAFARVGAELEAELDDEAPVSAVATGGDSLPLSPITVLKNWILVGFFVLVCLTLVAREIRHQLRLRQGVYGIFHANGRTITGLRGQSLLEAIRLQGIPHASVCGGRARCTTCRVRIGKGLENCPDPSGIEQRALMRIEAEPNVRLACQTRPGGDVHITPLVAPESGMDAARRPGGVRGSEQKVAAMFVDLRGSTQLGEKRLPYDVLFILNRFFSEISDALKLTDGHYAQFAGDGLMALYGLSSGLRQGCRDAMAGAVQMQHRIDGLNRSLAAELEQPLRIGIGLHCGDAIVGTMGPPKSPNYSAIGDNINAAARLESQSKEYDCVLVVSTDVVDQAGYDLSGFPKQVLTVRGKKRSIEAYTIADMAALEQVIQSHLATSPD